MPKGQNVVISEAAKSQFVFNIGESKTSKLLITLTSPLNSMRYWISHTTVRRYRGQSEEHLLNFFLNSNRMQKSDTNELLTYERNQEEEFEKFKTMSNKEILTFESTINVLVFRYTVTIPRWNTVSTLKNDDLVRFKTVITPQVTPPPNR